MAPGPPARADGTPHRPSSGVHGHGGRRPRASSSTCRATPTTAGAARSNTGPPYLSREPARRSRGAPRHSADASGWRTAPSPAMSPRGVAAYGLTGFRPPAGSVFQFDEAGPSPIAALRWRPDPDPRISARRCAPRSDIVDAEARDAAPPHRPPCCSSRPGTLISDGEWAAAITRARELVHRPRPSGASLRIIEAG